MAIILDANMFIVERRAQRQAATQIEGALDVLRVLITEAPWRPTVSENEGRQAKIVVPFAKRALRIPRRLKLRYRKDGDRRP
jgi:hypothetical protein